MNPDRAELKTLLDCAIDLARAAGAITLKYFRRSPEISTKADGSFVTIADREAESFLRREIADRFPADGILGEEGGEIEGSSGRRWIIDPIDGTFAFVHGVPFYGVLIALEINRESVLGVVNVPALDEIVYAGRDLGCFLNSRPCHVSDTPNLAEALLLSTDFVARGVPARGPALEMLQQRAKASRTWGDCYGYVLVATARADVMLDPVMNIWDCAPLLPIIEEAGGTFTDWSGRRTIAGGNAIATNRILFTEVMRVLGSTSL